ncbi:MAG TPA: PilZ domain-containing protein [Myxococcota bacterium]|nr:PilZ domain-containing protein [Myxococcota bacterium]
MSATVLLLDDGELESVRLLLEELGADFSRVHSRDAARSSILPSQLVIASARIAHALRLERALAPAPDRAVWFAFVTGDSKTQRTLLQKAGFDFLIREPVHPAALRVLLQRALFRGSDTRRVPRVACGHPVRYRVGFWPKAAMLVDLSPRGCRLLTAVRIPEKSALAITISAELAGGKKLKLKGHAVRVSPADREGGAVAEFSVGVRFGELDSMQVKQLRSVLAERVIGPASLGSAVPGSPTAARPAVGAAAPVPAAAAPASPQPRLPKKRVNRRARFQKQITAVGGGDSYMIMCRDLSVGGMRIEPVDSLSVGDKIALGIQISAREEPILVDAEVMRDDGENGLALRFDWIAPDSKRRVERLLETLPSIEPLQEDARRQGTILAQRLKRSPRE